MKPLDVRLFNAAEAATNILKEAAGTPFTKAEVAIQPSPDGEYTVLTLQFVVQHLGSVVPLNEQHEPMVADSVLEKVWGSEADDTIFAETPQEPAGDAETVLPYYQTEEHLEEGSQDVCGRCKVVRWRHHADESGGYYSCKQFVDAKQGVLV